MMDEQNKVLSTPISILTIYSPFVTAHTTGKIGKGKLEEKMKYFRKTELLKIQIKDFRSQVKIQRRAITKMYFCLKQMTVVR